MTPPSSGLKGKPHGLLLVWLYSKAGGSLLLWKFCQLLQDFMVSHCRRQ
jgi:hypothetical protein